MVGGRRVVREAGRSVRARRPSAGAREREGERVKIKGIDKRSGREFLVEQVIDGGGASPWDGRPYSADYAVTLVNALRDAEDAGSKLEEALEQIADLTPG